MNQNFLARKQSLEHNPPKFEQLGKSKQATTQGFAAINYITVRPDYAERMESLFESRAGFIDNCSGFRKMQALRPRSDTNEYLAISEWGSESDFIAWTQSAEFQLDHRRAFDDLAQVRKHNETPPCFLFFAPMISLKAAKIGQYFKLDGELAQNTSVWHAA